MRTPDRATGSEDAGSPLANAMTMRLMCLYFLDTSRTLKVELIHTIRQGASAIHSIRRRIQQIVQSRKSWPGSH